ncbi:MAG: LPS-assembly protein LptD [Alphaproteobacteria bacterium]
MATRLGLVAGAWVVALGGAAAQEPPAAGILLEAREVVWDAEGETATATGEVFLAREGYTLSAERVVYAREAETVRAAGDVVLVDPRGNASFAERMELSGDLATGFIESVALRLEDDSLLVARRADREAGNRTTLRDVTYTPCPVCPDAPPTWQINAAKVAHDQDERVVRYRNATFEIAGIPVLFTPFFSHADPSVERRSGFLNPTFTIDSELGGTAEVPYHWAMAPNRDLTIRPTFTTEENALLALDLRDLQRFGRTELTVSGTYASFGEGVDTRGRGHVDGDGRYRVGEDWDTGFDLELATDDTYLRRYGISNANVLDNRLFAHRVDNDRLVSVEALAFQDLRPDTDQGEVPYALPHLQSTFTGSFAALGADWEVRPNLLGLYRTQGIDSRRASLAGAVRLPQVSRWGDLVTASFSLRGDLYAVRGDAEAGIDDGDVRWRARVMPRATLDWRRPYARTGANGIAYGIEPVASVTAAPTGVDDPAIPNEDSLDLEFDETNLLRADRFTGLDRYDEGTKLSYGVRTSATGADRDLWSIFLGQSYRVSDTDAFAGVSGLEDDLSDIVGRVRASPHRWVDADYRFRIGADFGDLSKSDLQVVGGPPRLRLALGHLLLEDAARDGFDRREEGRAALSLRLTDSWSAIASTRRDLDKGEPILDTYGVLYEDACFTLVAGVERDFTRDRDALDGTTIAVRVGFRNLGEFGGTSALGDASRE